MAEVVNHLTNEIIENIRVVAQTTPSRFEDIVYLDDLNRELQEMHSYILVQENDRITYYGCETYPQELVEKLGNSRILMPVPMPAFILEGGYRCL